MRTQRHVGRDRKADKIQLELLRQAVAEALEQCWDGQMPFRTLERALAPVKRTRTVKHHRVATVAWR